MGCAPIPPSPAFKCSGTMTIEIKSRSGSDRIKGIFKVNGPEDKFHMYLLDADDIPRGRIVVRKGIIVKEESSIKGRAARIYRYWAYLFDSSGTDRMDVSGIRINYKKRVVVQGRRLPSQVEVITSGLTFYIKIDYKNIQNTGL